MARREPAQTKAETDHLDVRRLVVPVWAALAALISFVITTAAIVAGYFTLINQVQDIQRNVNSLLKAVDQATVTADAALRQGDLDNWCLKAQIANPTWRCPTLAADGTVIQPPRHRPTPSRPRPVEAKAN